MKMIVSVIVGVLAIFAAEPLNAENDSVATEANHVRSNNAWRYKFYQDHWWYWLPAKRWAVYANGRWLSPPGQDPIGSRSATTSKEATAAEDKQDVNFAEDYPAVPADFEAADHSAAYHLTAGSVFSRHAHEHAQMLERYAGSGGTVPANIVREQAKAIHHNVEHAQKSFSKVVAAGAETENENLRREIKKLQVGLKKVTESVQRLENLVQKQRTVQAELVRDETVIVSRLLQQANETARAAEEGKLRRQRDEEDRVGID